MDLSAQQLKQYLPACAAICLALVYLSTAVLESATLADSKLQQQTGTGPAGLENAPQPAAALVDVDFAALPGLHLFGRYSPKSEPELPKIASEPELDLSALPKTKINLKLSGIGFTSNDNRAYAIIVTPNGQHDHFIIGEEIVPNATVHLIERERVIIKRGGELEVLELPSSNSNTLNLPERNPRIAKNNRRSTKIPNN
ncbi:MAG: type II secretion system protein N [Gammaproteobacteria bacterium]